MALSNKQKKLLFSNLTRAVTLDRMMMRIIKAGKMTGFYHEGGISMASPVAAGTFLRKDDPMCPHYRAHGIGQMLAKGVDLKTYVAEHMGREAGCCKGRSSFHMSFPDDHIFGFSGNIGFNFPLCTGYGFAANYKSTDQVVMNCSGDGSYHEGRAYEAMHMAATWKLPVVFWCENNGISQHSLLKDVFPIEEISNVAAALGIPTLVVDGQDLFACGEAALKAVTHARKGKGPIFVEIKILRSQEHNVGGLNYDGATPRSQELMDEWKATRDPLKLATEKVLEEGLMTKEEIDQLNLDAEQEAEDIETFSEQSPKAMPSIEEMLAAVYVADKSAECR